MLVSHAEIGSQRRRVLRAGLWLAALMPAAGPAALGGAAPPAAASGSGCATPVVKPVGPFHIGSDNRTILDKNGRKFISYGTTVPGLSGPKRTTVPSTDLPKI